MIIKNFLASTIGFAKQLFTFKIILIFLGLISFTYYIKKKFLHKTNNNETYTQESTLTSTNPDHFRITQSNQQLRGVFTISNDSKKDLVIILLKMMIPKDVVEKILSYQEREIAELTAQKNILFLSFYQPDFIGISDLIIETFPPQFPFIGTVELNNCLQANFIPGNPYRENSKDFIRISNQKTKTCEKTSDQESYYIKETFIKFIELIPELNYQNLEECYVINRASEIAQKCDSPEEIRIVACQLFKIESLKLRKALFEQLKLASYRFWYDLKLDEVNQKTKLEGCQTILVHTHYFYWNIQKDINNSWRTDPDRKASRIDIYSITQNEATYQTDETVEILGKNGSFSISSDSQRKLVNYPHPFVLITRSAQDESNYLSL